MNKIKSFEDLKVWQLAIELATKVYRLTMTFPNDERYGIIDQLKRAVTSISANIAEGFGRYHFKDSVKFLYNARGSLSEVHSFLLLSKRLELIDRKTIKDYDQILLDIRNLGVKLNNLISAIMKKQRTTELPLNDNRMTIE